MPIGKKENSFNRCQSEKLNDQIWISKRRYWLYSRIRSLTFSRLRPFRIKCEQHYSSENTFLFRHKFFRNRKHFSFSHAIKAEWTFAIWTQRESTQRRKSRTTTRSYSDVKLRKAHQVTKKYTMKIVNWRKKNDKNNSKSAFAPQTDSEKEDKSTLI